MEKSGNINTDAYNALQKEIEDTSTDLKKLKQDAKDVSNEFGNPISPEQYDALQREIIETEQNLESLQEQAGKTSTSLRKNGITRTKNAGVWLKSRISRKSINANYRRCRHSWNCCRKNYR